MIPEGTIIANTGLLRQGKTMNATRLAYLDYVQGRRVYTNYDTAFSVRLQNIPQLYAIPTGSLIVLDELQSIIDSREFSNNIDLTHWLTLIGKDGLSLLYTVQNFGMVDVRLRQLTGWLYFAEKKIKTGRKNWIHTLLHLYAVSPVGSARLMKKLLMPHPPIYNLYATRDKKVVLGQNLDDMATTPMARQKPNKKNNQSQQADSHKSRPPERGYEPLKGGGGTEPIEDPERSYDFLYGR